MRAAHTGWKPVPHQRLIARTVDGTMLQPMSRLVSRILLSILMFPLAAILYILVFVAIIHVNYRVWYPTRQIWGFLVGGAVTWAFVAGYWCLLWKSGVRWNTGRIASTFAAAAGSVLAAAFIALFCILILPYNGPGMDFYVFVGSLLTIALWLLATVFIWRETAAERAERLGSSGRSTVTCPTCGYNLTGLNEARCPECGSKYTLDELMASQPHTAGEIE